MGGIYVIWKDGLFVGLRSEIEFKKWPRFDKAVDKLRSASMEIVADVNTFQQAYKRSDVDSELPKRFNLTQLENVAGRYNLYEIYVGPKNSYRAIVMFPHRRIRGRLLAYWLFAFKKQRNIDRPMIERAKAIARECWNSIEGD
jgi:hypothetical protein